MTIGPGRLVIAESLMLATLHRAHRRRSPRRGLPRTRLVGALAPLLTVSALLVPGLLARADRGLDTTPALRPAAAAPAVRQCVPDPLRCPGHLLFGAFTDGQPLDLGPLASFAGALGFDPGVALTFTSFRFQINDEALRRVVGTGRLPMVTWEPFDATDPTADTFDLAQLAAGAYDDYLAEAGRRLAAVGGPVAVRFAHEMNGGWYPWGVAAGATSAADYVAAYRHVHDVVLGQGATNVLWVWSPGVIASSPSQPLDPLYPGDAYVDWVGLSAYFDEVTDTWANTVAPTTAVLDSLAPTKPIFLVESAVLGVPQRPQMVADLVQAMLRTPRVIGLTWFDSNSRQAWRIDDDAATMAALGDQLRGGWFLQAGQSDGQVTTPVAPVLQIPPLISGNAKVGSTLAVSPALWRPAPWTTTSVPSARWWRCRDAVDTSTCQGQPNYTGSYLVTTNDLGQFVRVKETVTADPGSGAGTVVSWSAGAGSVVMLPATPAAPTVESWNGGARVVFPTPPRGTTHWRLTVDGTVYELVPVSKPDYWLTALTNGRSYAVSLQAASVSVPLTLTSGATSGTVVPMTTPWVPYVSVTGPTASFTLPQAPTGATAWVLTVDGVARVVDRSQTSVSVTDLAGGVTHTWGLQAAAGSWPGTATPGGFGALTPPRTGTFVPLSTPATPVVTSGGGSITLQLPPPPVGATAWRISVGPTTYSNVPLSQPSFTVSGLYPGYPATWTLKATNDLAASLPVTGKAVP